MLLLVGFVLTTDACRDPGVNPSGEPKGQSGMLFNTAHLDHLGEDVVLGDSTLRIVHIYSEEPDYDWVGDADEGIACVDDAARAAVVYLRHAELTGDGSSLQKARALIRFVMYMQSEDGLFFNFVWDNGLRVNRAHQNSVADEFGWWASRAVWALGTAARVLKDIDQEISQAAAARVRRALPHVEELLEDYGNTVENHGRQYPLWLVHRYASDATSEMLLGLVALEQAYPSSAVRELIERFAGGIASMQFGSLGEFPYAAHASYLNEWHGWGNSQTQALAEARMLDSAIREADNFFPRLLIEGWLHSFRLDDPESSRKFSQIAYAVRGVSVGLVRLYEATGERKYAVMAGLAASWFSGNNVAGVAMYDGATGRGYDGINSADSVNRNAGAESTIEALMTVLEIEQVSEARPWMHARGESAQKTILDGEEILYRIFVAEDHETSTGRRLGLVANLSSGEIQLLEGKELDGFIGSASE
jgi:hypothetical protein